MKRNRYILILFFCFAEAFVCYSQAPQFSQFYAAPTYLNPAFAGETTQNRLSLNNRIQWPSIPGAFQSYNFNFDSNIESMGAGLGLLVTHDRAGTGLLRYTNVSGIYSHRIPLNKFWSLKLGLQAGQTMRDIDINNLQFGSQIYNGGSIPSNVILNYQKVSYPDFATGILLYSNKMWAGFAAHHLSLPNQSLLSDESLIPIKLSLHGGVRYVLATGTTTKSMVFAFNYKAQGKFDQLDIGTYYDQEPLVFGIWYRGLPGKAYQPGYSNRDAIVFLVGYTIKDLRIGYSYDATISKLSGNTFGANELSISYELIDKRKRISKRRRHVPCAKF